MFPAAPVSQGAAKQSKLSAPSIGQFSRVPSGNISDCLEPILRYCVFT
tara:strand:+ start:373 stop:516 length:144 start_codon:yes stop_codon:yes gene_type:complete